MRKMVPQAAKNLEVKRFGNASHVILPKEFAGKKVVVFVNRE
jgi:putative transposon-encoded protein